MNDIMKSFDIKKQVDLVILDFSKAFDTVPHHKLLHKLASYGIDGKINQWIKAFPTQRHQRVVVEGEFSSACSRFWSATGDCSWTLALPVPHK
jgi:hypothetical protein